MITYGTKTKSCLIKLYKGVSKMKQIYIDILSEGATAVADSSGENEKGENLALVAEIEMENQLKLFPEMLDTLKWVKGWMEQYTTQNDTIKRVSDMIDKAEGGK